MKEVVVEWVDGVSETLSAQDVYVGEEIELLLEDNKAMWLNKSFVRCMTVTKEVEKNE